MSAELRAQLEADVLEGRRRWSGATAGEVGVVKGHVMAAGYGAFCLFASWLNLRKGAKR